MSKEESVDEPSFKHEDIEQSVVQIHATHMKPDYIRPWGFAKKSHSTGSGFAIKLGNKNVKIITNAHCVHDASGVTVKLRGSSKLHKATVEFIMYECDLALLSIDEKIDSLELGELPSKLDTVYVYGYPLGGYNISVTKGIVNRIQIIPYFGVTQGITIQIDAPINFGNSGGPVIGEDGKVVGVAFAGEARVDVENMGYIIPTVLIDFFLKTYQAGKDDFIGLCSLDITTQNLTETISKYLKTKDATGILVCKVSSIGSSNGHLEAMDVITHIDDISIDNDGTMKLHDIILESSKNKGDKKSKSKSGKSKSDDLIDPVGDVAPYRNLISLKQPGDKVKVSIIRDGKNKTIDITLKPIHETIPKLEYQSRPSYFIVAGLVFIPLNHMVIYEKFNNKEPIDNLLCVTGVGSTPSTKDERFVILSEILSVGSGANTIASSIDLELDDWNNQVLQSVNSIDILNLEHLHKIVQEQLKKEDYIVFRFKQTPRIIVLSSNDIKRFNNQILKENLGPGMKDYLSGV